MTTMYSVWRGLSIGLAIAMGGIAFSLLAGRSLNSEPARAAEPRPLAETRPVAAPSPAVDPRLRAEAHPRAEPQPVVATLSADEILAAVRGMGLAPNTLAIRRGPYYVLHAVDRRGNELRVVADAQFGDILSLTPAHPVSTEPGSARGPRIIHVPDADDGRTDNDDDAVPSDAAVLDEPAPPRQHARIPAAAPAPSRMAADNPDAALSPIRPTPNFSARRDTPPPDKAPIPSAALPPPPVGYTPPSALPQNP